jgi:serine phosphatase RsbU (regulator of sigma subunit)
VSATRSHCLIASIFEPPLLRLDPAREYAVGREPAADIFLPARQVSRRHAKLSWSAEDGGFVIRDTWSRRGLRVNGNQTERRVLRDGDDIAIDPYHLRYRVYEGDVTRLTERSDGTLPRDWRLSGRAGGPELLELVALIDVADVAAILEVDADPHSGTLRIAGGQVLEAEASFLRGSRAAHALLTAESCAFRLRAAERPAGEAGRGIPIVQLLSEILARMGSDFVTTLDSSGIQEGEVMQLEKRLQAARTERELRALAGQELRAEDVARAQERQRSLQQSTLPRDARVGFERFSRPVAGAGGGFHAVTQLAPGAFRVFIGEPSGSVGVDGLLRSMLLETEVGLASQPAVRPADVLNLIHRRLAHRPEELRFTASCLDVTLDRAGGATASYAANGPLALLLCRDGEARVPELDPGAGATLDGVRIIAAQLALRPKDRLLVFAGSLARQRDAGGGEIGLARLAAAAGRACRLEARAALEALVGELDALRGGAPQEGDVTIVAVELR